MPNHPNNWYLEGIKKQSSEVLRNIFSEFLPQIDHFVRNNSGSSEDAEDVFMYAIEVIYRKVQADELVLTAAFSTYLNQICRWKWYKDLRSKKKIAPGVTLDDPMVSNILFDPNELYFELTECYQMIRENLSSLSKDCQLVLSHSWHTDLDMKSIAEQMGWTYGYTRTRKYECTQFLIKAIKNDYRFEDCRN